ncbi:restriction endonuclease [Deinococcus sp. UYEF24]
MANPKWFWLVMVIGLLAAGLFIWFKVKTAQQRRQTALKLQDLQALTPRQLELHVATVVGSLPGWKAEATRSSSDQGADVIATSPTGIRVAVQVKHYRSPVGNKAVQEIVASKAFYRAEHAVVVTSGPGYTRSALELARANDVRLWQANDLFALQVLAEQGRKPDRTLLPG